MPDYSNAKIYTIRCRSNQEYIYVGSTTQPLSKRWGEHKGMSKSKVNRLIYSTINNDWTDWFIELYQEYPCENREQLLKREGEVIREICATLNKQIAGQTQKEYRNNRLDLRKNYDKEYREQNKEKKKKEDREYREANVEKIKQYRIDNVEKIKQYRIDNAERIKQYRIDNAEKIKQYYIDNKDEINRKKREYRQKK